MGSSTVTGAGHGAADRTSPPKVKRQRIIGSHGPRILMAGVAVMLGGLVEVRFPTLPEGYIQHTTPIVVAHAPYQVYIDARGEDYIVVKSTETDADFDFSWMIITTGIRTDLEY